MSSKTLRILFACTILLFTGISTETYAQETTIKGFIRDQDNGETIPYALIKTDKGGGARANENGFFSLPQLQGENIQLQISAPGYSTLDTTIALGESIVNLQIDMVKVAQQIGTATVSAKKVQKTKLVDVGVTRIEAKDIKSIPSVGGEPDLAQYLQLTAGVTSTGDQGGQLFIRGGSPVQNKILMDGATIYNPFHSIGIYSIFETDLIKNSKVISGGFNAEYGDRTSAIVDVTMKDGNNRNLIGKVSASPIMSRLVLEGPLSKPGEKGANNTFILSAKYGYMDKTSKTIYKGLDGINEDDGLPYNFSDVYSKLSFGSDQGSKLSVYGFNFRDKNDFSYIPSFHWNSVGAGANFILNPLRSNTLITGDLTYSNYVIQSIDDNASDYRYSSIGGFQGGLAFNNFLKNYGELKYGFEIQGFSTKYLFKDINNTNSDIVQYTSQAAMYVQYRKNFNNKFIIEPGLRFMYYSSLSEVSLEPRLGIKYNVSDNFRLKAAAGKYSQNLISTKSDQDIVNYFTGFLSGSDDDIRDFQGNPSKTNLQKAYHALAGLEVDVNNLELSLEGWYKDFNPLININRLRETVNDPFFMLESSVAQGVDFSFKYLYKYFRVQSVFGFMNITRSFVKKDGSTQTYPPPFDRRYNFNIAASYDFGKEKSWSVSTRATYGSPLPFTRTQAFYQNYDFQNQGPGTNILDGNGTLGLLYSTQLNDGRLSPYARWDVSLEKFIQFSGKKSLNINLSFINVMNRKNVFYINRISNNLVYQLPFLPSIATSFSF